MNQQGKFSLDEAGPKTQEAACPHLAQKGNPLHLLITGIKIPSFKNHKRAGINKHTGKLMSYTDSEVKEKMERLENSILFALYSASQTTNFGTLSECQKQLQIALSGLSDDSIREIPAFSYAIQYVEPGQEGVEIIIERIN